MKPSIYRISLDVHDAHSSVCLDMMKQDTARQISIALTDGGFPYRISEECYAVFTATKPDGNKLRHPCSIRDNTIQYIVRPQTTAAAGMCECEIKLYGADDNLITSPGFNILVNDTAYNEGDEIESETEVEALTHLISEATTVINEGKNVNAQGEALIEEMTGKKQELLGYVEQAAESAEIAKGMANGAKKYANDAEIAAREAMKYSAAPDLAQNDPAQTGYIKNRTHWVESEEVAVFWDGSTMGRRPYTDPMGTVYYKIADKCPEEECVLGSTIELSNGNTQTVNSKMFYGFSNGAAKVGGYLYIRNKPAVSAGNVIDPDSVGIYATAGTVYPVAFRYGENVVHTLDEKFIPDTIARKADIPDISDFPEQTQPDWNQNDSTQSDYVKNRTHWIEPRTVTLFEAAIEMEPRSDITEGTLINVAENPIPLELTEGKTYIVVWNGRVYSCVCQKQAYYYTGAGYNHFWYLGNLDFVGNAGDLVNNGAEMPFLIRRDECYTNATKQWTTTSTVFTNGNEATVANVMIGGEGAVYHALDEGFIPDTIARKTDIPEGLPEATAENEGKVLGVVDGEWKPVDAPAGAGSSVQPNLLQNDSEQPDYVKNRTHWEELDVRTICTWDGNTEGLEQFELAGITFYKRTTEANPPTLDALYGCEIRTIENGVQKEGSLIGSEFDNVVEANSELGAVNCCFVGHFMVVYDTEFSIMGETYTVSSPGIWVMPTFRVLRYGEVIVHTLAEKFIPDTIARKIANKITLVSPSGTPFDITVSDDGVLSANGTPISGGEVLTDDTEQLAMLIKADLLPAVHDTSGAILTDEKGNIVLRY